MYMKITTARLCLALLLSATSLSLAAPEVPKKITELEGVWLANFNQNATRVIVQMRSGTLGLWDTEAGTPIPGDLGIHTTKGNYVVNDAANLAIILPLEGKPHAIDLSTGKSASPKFDATANKNHNGQSRVYFTPDSSSVIFFDDTNAARIFERSSGKLVSTLQPTKNLPDEANAPSPEIIFSEDGHTALILGENGILHRYDSRTWKKKGPSMPHPDRGADHYGFAASEDALHAVTFDSPGENGPSGQMQLWDIATSSAIGKPISARNGLSGHFFADGKRLLITPSRGETRVVSIPTLQTVATLPRHDDVEASRALLTNDESKVLTWGYDSRVTLTDASTGKHIGIYPGRARVKNVISGPEPNTAIIIYDNTAFSLQGHYDYYVVKIGLEKMRPLRTLRIQKYLHRSILSPDGTRLMIHEGKTDKERIRLFDASTLVELPTTAQP
jgi:WD40 repeat protein